MYGMADNDQNGSGGSSGSPRDDGGEGREPESRLEKLLAARWDPGKLSKFLSNSGKSRSEKLDHSQRSRFEGRLGVDLGNVRIFTGELAEQITRAHNAEALTIGDTGMIVMRQSSHFGPRTAAGTALLAHELTHVAQGRQSSISRKADMTLAHDQKDASEAEAEAMEAEVLAEEQGGPPASAKAHDSKKGGDEDKKEKLLNRVLVLHEEFQQIEKWRAGSGH